MSRAKVLLAVGNAFNGYGGVWYVYAPSEEEVEPCQLWGSQIDFFSKRPAPVVKFSRRTEGKNRKKWVVREEDLYDAFACRSGCGELAGGPTFDPLTTSCKKCDNTPAWQLYS